MDSADRALLRAKRAGKDQIRTAPVLGARGRGGRGRRARTSDNPAGGN